MEHFLLLILYTSFYLPPTKNQVFFLKPQKGPIMSSRCSWRRQWNQGTPAAILLLTHSSEAKAWGPYSCPVQLLWLGCHRWARRDPTHCAPGCRLDPRLSGVLILSGSATSQGMLMMGSEGGSWDDGASSGLGWALAHTSEANQWTGTPQCSWAPRVCWAGAQAAPPVTCVGLWVCSQSKWGKLLSSSVVTHLSGQGPLTLGLPLSAGRKSSVKARHSLPQLLRR